MSDGFKHPVHIPKIQIRDRKSEDQPDDQPDDSGIMDYCMDYYLEFCDDYGIDGSHLFVYLTACVIACVWTVIAFFVWNFLVDIWVLIRWLLFSGIGVALCESAKGPWGRRFLPPMMAKMVAIVGVVIYSVYLFLVGLILLKPVSEYIFGSLERWLLG